MMGTVFDSYTLNVKLILRISKQLKKLNKKIKKK